MFRNGVMILTRSSTNPFRDLNNYDDSQSGNNMPRMYRQYCINIFIARVF